MGHWREPGPIHFLSVQRPQSVTRFSDLAFDMVVQSTLTEIGQYTLRVMVEYRDQPTSQGERGGTHIQNDITIVHATSWNFKIHFYF